MNDEQINLPSNTELPVTKQLPEGGGALYVGDVTTMVVTLPKNLADAAPSFVETLKNGSLSWGDGRMLKHQSETNESGDVVHRFSVSCYKPGICKIPGVNFLGADGKTAATTQAQELNYSSVGNPEKEPELYEPLGVQLPLEIIMGIVLASTLILAALSVIFWKIYRTIKNKRLLNKPKTPIQKLNALEELVDTYKNIGNKRHLDNSEFKKYYFSVSESLKTFISRTCKFDAQEKTTSEIKTELMQVGALDENAKTQWIELFAEMDVVKFTDHVPEVEVAQQLMQKSLLLAQKTFALLVPSVSVNAALESEVKR